MESAVGKERVCMNRRCSSTSNSNRWRPGWTLSTGQVADLCNACGLAYEQFRFCEAFHSDDAGWRTCNSCDKRIHCGCVASLKLYACLDTGGVECKSCIESKGVNRTLLQQSLHNLKLLGSFQVSEQGTYAHGQSPADEGDHEKGPLYKPWPSSHTAAFLGSMRRDLRINESDIDLTGEGDLVESAGTGINLSRRNLGLRVGGASRDVVRADLAVDAEDALVAVASDLSLHEDLRYGASDCSRHSDSFERNRSSEEFDGITIGRSLNLVNDMPGAGITESSLLAVDVHGRDAAREAAQQTGSFDLLSTGSLGQSNGEAQDDLRFPGVFRSRPRQIAPRPSGPRFETSPGDGQVRAARLPAEGRGRAQLLPRYWPRITDKELQQISGAGDNTKTITPLFEKVLSASDAGRIGRLVLPKACAEAYFPQISQPEGVPMKIQDVSGKVWSFQFRFWPNNNSRMYVLEGVTPCIQKLQLQAGDTVTFSRMEPGGRLVMGYRRSPTSAAFLQDHINLGYAGGDAAAAFPQSLSEGPPGAHVSAKAPEAVYKPPKAKSQERSPESAMLQQLLMVDWKRARPLGSKTKRLRIETEDSVQLKSSWEEVQDLFRPPPSCAPNIVSIEGHEFEEYEEPPVLAKKTVFTLQHSKWAGEEAVHCSDCEFPHMAEDQWAQCENCAIWRRVPSDVVISSRWTCSENHWDPERASCSEPQELTNEEIEQLLLTTGAEYMRQGVDGAVVRETTALGLDALADAAALREEAVAVGAMPVSPTSPVRTTKHPRHRPGCTCIVCIQPPSGKGPKHKPNCICNVCVTVKRRFKTLELRRKKRDIDVTHVRKRKSFQYGRDGGDGEHNKVGTSKLSFRSPENGSYDRVGPLLQESSVPVVQGVNSPGISRKGADRSSPVGLTRRDELATKMPSVRLELRSEKPAAGYSRSNHAGDEEGSWRSRPSEIDLNMQPDAKHEMHDKAERGREQDLGCGSASGSLNLLEVAREVHVKHTVAGPFYGSSSDGKSMHPPLLVSDGSNTRNKVSFEKLEHRSSSGSGPGEGSNKNLQSGEATSRLSAKGPVSDLGVQQGGQFAGSSFSNAQSMDTDC